MFFTRRCNFIPGLKPEQIESGATNYLSLYRKIERGHCDIVVDMEEVFWGFDHLGSVPFSHPDFAIRPLPDAERFPLHFAVSSSPRTLKKLSVRSTKEYNNLQTKTQATTGSLPKSPLSHQRRL